MLIKTTGDERINEQCASVACGGQVTHRLEAGGVGSYYCSACAQRIEELAIKFKRQLTQ